MADTAFINGTIIASDWLNDVNTVVYNGTLSNLNDVTLTSPSNGQVLSYNGTDWVNSSTTVSSVAWSAITDKPTTLSGYGIDTFYAFNNSTMTRLIARGSGGEANVNMVIRPLGTGGIRLAEGVETRGTYSIELQHLAYGTNIASGNRSILIGNDSEASGFNCRVFGSQCAASADYSSAIGFDCTSSGLGATAIGYQATASGVQSLSISTTSNLASGTQGVAIGNSNTASSDQSFAIGNSCLSSAGQSFAVGSFAKSRYDRKLAFSGRNLGTASQLGVTVLAGTTTDATPKVLTSNSSAAGATNQIITPVNSVYSFRILVAGRRSDATADGAGYEFVGVALTDTTVSFIGTPTKTVLGETDASWDCDVGLDTTNNAIKITVTGASGKTIQWVATAFCVESAI
jgi:hypothetical protein